MIRTDACELRVSAGWEGSRYNQLLDTHLELLRKPRKPSVLIIVPCGSNQFPSERESAVLSLTRSVRSEMLM
jgi:hypothetical protein